MMSYLAFQFFLEKEKKKNVVLHACFDPDKYIFWRHYYVKISLIIAFYHFYRLLIIFIDY